MKERERLAALGQIAAGLAHEIRNPLGAIKGAAQLLADPAPGGAGPDPREFLGIILQEVDRLDQVVGSVLDLARPDPEEVAAPIDVGPVVQRTLQILAPEWGDDGALEVSVELGAGVAPAAIAPERLMQVVMNLARNAVQAMGGRGRLTVTTRRRAGGAGGRGLSDGAGEFVEIAVADTGAGIPAPIMPQLFQPFFTTKDKGTGLGLAICQRIVRAAAGRIEVHSSEGCGATFAVVLPAVHAGAPPCAAAAGAAKG
ncbi:MAG: two-component system sensor protein, partial [Deltaproteobacteria bacterium]|nr:two-component system sensor protein [Deltaproteobacteria bacterium]